MELMSTATAGMYLMANGEEAVALICVFFLFFTPFVTSIAKLGFEDKEAKREWKRGHGAKLQPSGTDR